MKSRSKPAKRLTDCYDHLPPWIKELDHAVHLDLQVMSHQFFVGTPGTGGLAPIFVINTAHFLRMLVTGAPLHWHSDAWNACAHGQRRWFLFPPEIAIYTNIPFKQWWQEEYPKLSEERKPLECMQRGGDVLFVPNHYGHGTYSVQESVGVAVEFASWMGGSSPSKRRRLSRG